MPLANPCQSCGACCAHFRVSFYWAESEPAPEAVPLELTEDLPPYSLCMQGTNRSHPYCAALQGEIGKQVSCAIYANRPSPCREFGIHFHPDGLKCDPNDLPRCNQARAAWNLPPLAVEIEQVFAPVD